MSKFSGKKDLYDFIEEYGGFEKFKADTCGKIYIGRGIISFNKKKDIAPYYSHCVKSSYVDSDMQIVEISIKPRTVSLEYSEASRDFFKWQEEREVKRLNDLDE